MPDLGPEARPRLAVEWQRADCILAGVCVLLLLGFLLPWLASWGPLPERIPTRFDSDGRATDWGPRGTIWMLPLIALGTSVLLLVLTRIPHLYNYPWPITPANAEFQYRMARRLMLVVACLVTAMFLFIYLGTWRVALGLWPGLSGAFVVVAVGVLMTSILGYLVVARPREPTAR